MEVAEVEANGEVDREAEIAEVEEEEEEEEEEEMCVSNISNTRSVDSEMRIKRGNLTFSAICKCASKSFS